MVLIKGLVFLNSTTRRRFCGGCPPQLRRAVLTVTRR
jgi:hypothetical protein